MRASSLVGISLVVPLTALPLRADEPGAVEVSPAAKAALDRISADSLKGHLSFLASDLLEGRGTPSRGLDLAAEYIAAQYRRAGLEPVGDDGYFQTATWQIEDPDRESLSISFRLAGERLPVYRDQMSLSAAGKLDIDRAPLVRLDLKDAGAMSQVEASRVEGKAVLVDLP